MQLLHIYHNVDGSDEVEAADIQQMRQPLPSDGTQQQPHEDEVHAGEEYEDVDSDSWNVEAVEEEKVVLLLLKSLNCRQELRFLLFHQHCQANLLYQYQFFHCSEFLRHSHHWLIAAAAADIVHRNVLRWRVEKTLTEGLEYLLLNCLTLSTQLLLRHKLGHSEVEAVHEISQGKDNNDDGDVEADDGETWKGR
jgi:hypothetical protein